ncbi:hypothetical protein [Psychromonas arctica]|uniref:hypothetical protein n=1 Tax=Psychromonas arctica TaxID=168275 RepID=UPI000417CB24|nr:hypothetical protein [Psychromonas arctica]
MFTKRYKAKELIDIIAAPSYSPDLLRIIEKTKNGKKLGTFLSAKPRLGVTGTIAKDYVSSEVEGSIPYFTTKQVRENLFATLDQCKYISKEADLEWAHCRVSNGSIIINKSGRVGAAAIVNSGSFDYVNSVSDIINIKLEISAPIDKYFLVVFLNNIYGQSQLIRLCGGAVFDHVSLHEIPDIRLPNVGLIAQTYIGNKVRQAEVLAEWAKNKDEEIQTYHSAYIPDQTRLNFGKKTRLVSATIMTERMDAHFYPGVVDTYLSQKPENFGKLSGYCNSIFNGQTQTQTQTGKDGCKQVTVANLSPDYIKGHPRIVEAPKNKEKLTKKYDLLMCNAAHNKSYIGKDITFVHSDKPLLPSTEVMVIRTDSSRVPSSYLRTYLLSKLGFVQIQSTIRGITAHSYPTDMEKLDIFVPKLEGKELERWLATDQSLAKAALASECSTQLTIAAKFIVEALIEGIITEAEIIVAQQALDDGDNSKDKAILSKLTDKGFGEKKGDLLFSDLNVLYDLFDEVKFTKNGKGINDE